MLFGADWESAMVLGNQGVAGRYEYEEDNY